MMGFVSLMISTWFLALWVANQDGLGYLILGFVFIGFALYCEPKIGGRLGAFCCGSNASRECNAK